MTTKAPLRDEVNRLWKKSMDASLDCTRAQIRELDAKCSVWVWRMLTVAALIIGFVTGRSCEAIQRDMDKPKDAAASRAEGK